MISDSAPPQQKKFITQTRLDMYYNGSPNYHPKNFIKSRSSKVTNPPEGEKKKP